MYYLLLLLLSFSSMFVAVLLLEFMSFQVVLLSFNSQNLQLSQPSVPVSLLVHGAVVLCQVPSCHVLLC